MRILLLDLIAFQCGGPTAAAKNFLRTSSNGRESGSIQSSGERTIQLSSHVPLLAGLKTIWTVDPRDRQDRPFRELVQQLEPRWVGMRRLRSYFAPRLIRKAARSPAHRTFPQPTNTRLSSRPNQ